jgi:hypothetical protein
MRSYISSYILTITFHESFVFLAIPIFGIGIRMVSKTPTELAFYTRFNPKK